MSFILDALKKSENERQHNVPPEFATVPADMDSPRAPRWLWILGGLLLINLVVVVALLMRESPPPVATNALGPASLQTPEAGTPADSASPARPADAFTDRLEQARRQLPERAAENSPSATRTAGGNEPARPDSRPPARPAASTNVALLPSLDELRLNGEVDLPEMHIDIHVWSENARERFVFINMDKYRERETMSIGPVVTEITRDGVVLEHRGRRFMLPRD